MMKFVSPDTTTMSLQHGEQYDNCSELPIGPEMTSLEKLDPAILSCGLPAIVFNDKDTSRAARTTMATSKTKVRRAPHLPSLARSNVSFNLERIRYSAAHLQDLRKSPFSRRRPAAIDDPRTAQYPIWQRTCSNHQERVRRISGTDEELMLHGGGASGRKSNDRQRDNGFNPPRFRRNHEFSNRNHHVIVKSYHAGDGGGGHYGAVRLQDTIIEEEPEWVASGPTSRLDTIELRGFDEDMARTVTESMKASPTGKHRGAFYDDLLHYEHVHPKHGGGDGESVSTSNNGSPPPARSTPTKNVSDMNNNGHGVHGRKGSLASAHSSYSASGGGVNVSNFEELMKFDSILGDSGDSNSSRFSKYYRRGSSGGSSGGHQYQHHQHQHQGSQHHQQQQQHHVRFALDRNTHHYTNGDRSQQHHQHQRQAGSGRLSLSNLQHAPTGIDTSYPDTASAVAAPGSTISNGDVKSFQRLLEMMAANQRHQQQQQQQYLLQLLQNCQQTETLRQMLMKKCSLENAAAAAVAAASINGGGDSGQHQRVPTQAELQLHTQTIMKQALLRKKIVEQSRLIMEQQNSQEPIPAVQQLIQSICPNVQHNLLALSSGGSQHQQQHLGPEGRNGPAGGGALYATGQRGLPRQSNRRS
ncbi:protein cup-like [Anopheles nili]|uniref:protein cup-like n=1 Tax=Anopheles nili TaxID=185578 RepID=UPI00237A21DF|nr:protein cup-like [Anopheles nili]